MSELELILLFFYHVPITMLLKNHILQICYCKIQNQLLRVVIFFMLYGPSMFSRRQTLFPPKSSSYGIITNIAFKKQIPKYSLKTVETALLKVLLTEILSGWNELRWRWRHPQFIMVDSVSYLKLNLISLLAWKPELYLGKTHLASKLMSLIKVNR